MCRCAIETWLDLLRSTVDSSLEVGDEINSAARRMLVAAAWQYGLMQNQIIAKLPPTQSPALFTSLLGRQPSTAMPTR